MEATEAFMRESERQIVGVTEPWLELVCTEAERVCVVDGWVVGGERARLACSPSVLA